MNNITQTWEYPSEQIWPAVDSSTIATSQIDVRDLEDSLDRYTYMPVQTQDVAVFVACDFGDGLYDHERKCQPKKYFWRPKRFVDLFNSTEKNIIVLEGSEDYLGFSGETIATMSKWPDIWGQIEYQEVTQRGVYSPKYRRKILFSKAITFKTADLPRWKPTAIIGKRNFEVEDAQ